MPAIPDRILTSATEIGRLSAQCTELDDEAHVRLRFADGREVEGVVAVRPSVQVFRDASGSEGSNALLRLDTGEKDAPLYLWLDDLEEVVRLGSA
jgi:hypothetical protein